MTQPFDDLEDLLGGIFGMPSKPKNPYLAYLPTDTRLWLAKITREAKAKEKRDGAG